MIACAAASTTTGCSAGADRAKAKVVEQITMTSAVPTSAAEAAGGADRSVDPTTSGPPAGDGDGVSESDSVGGVATRDSAESAVEVAVAAGDICAVYDAVTALQLTATTAEGWAATLDTVAGAMVSARTFVPAEVAVDWEEITAGTSTAVDSLHRDAPMSEIAPIYEQAAFMRAEHRVDEWMGSNCE